MGVLMGAIYLLLWLPYYKIYDVDARPLTETLEYNTHKQVERSEEYIESFFWQDGSYARDSMYFYHAWSIYVETEHLLGYIDSVKAELEQSETCINNKAVVRQIMLKENRVDSIQHKLNRLILRMNNLLDPRSRGRFIAEAWHLLGEDQIWGKSPDAYFAYWAPGKFEDVDTDLAIALLAALETDVALVSSEMLRQLVVMAGDYISCGFNTFNAIAIPSSDFCLPGQKQTAVVGLINYDRYRDLKICDLSSGVMNKTDWVILKWEGKANGLGKHKVTGNLVSEYRGGSVSRPFSFEYVVIDTGCAMHLDNMNVCYAGVPVMINVSVPGYTGDQLNVRAAGAIIRNAGQGQFELLVKQTGKLFVFVGAKNKYGTSTTLGSREITVKPAPLPYATVAELKSGEVDYGVLLQQDSIKLQFNADDIDLAYSVQEFEFNLVHDGKPLFTEPLKFKGGIFPPKLVYALKDAVSGDRVYFTGIMVSLKGSKMSMIPSVTLKVK